MVCQVNTRQAAEDVVRLQIILLVGSVVVGLLGCYWTLEWTLPLRAQSVGSQLSTLAREDAGGHVHVRRRYENVPLLGRVSRQNISVGGGEITLVRATRGTFVTPSYFGYIYQPGTTVRTIGAPDGCARHLFGSWWEYRLNIGASCPYGMAFVPGG